MEKVLMAIQVETIVLDDCQLAKSFFFLSNWIVWLVSIEDWPWNQWSVINGERCGGKGEKQTKQTVGVSSHWATIWARKEEEAPKSQKGKWFACAVCSPDSIGFFPSYHRDRLVCDGCERNVPSPSDAHRSHPFPMIYLAGGRRTLTEQIDNMADQPHTALFDSTLISLSLSLFLPTFRYKYLKKDKIKSIDFSLDETPFPQPIRSFFPFWFNDSSAGTRTPDESHDQLVPTVNRGLFHFILLFFFFLFYFFLSLHVSRIPLICLSISK